MKKPPIYLSYAGFYIQFNLHYTEYEHEAKFFIHYFKKYFKGNVLTDGAFHTANFFVDIISTTTLSLSRNAGDNYVGFYKLHPKQKNRVITYYSVSPAQIVVLVRYILFELIQESGFIVHASSIILNNKCFAFSAPSGTGKSTVVRLLKPYAQPFSDDELVIKKIKKRYFCYQLPTYYKKSYPQKTHLGYPLQHIYLLKRDGDVYVKNTTSKSISAFLKEIVQTSHKKTVHHYFALMQTSIPKILHFKKNGKAIKNVLRPTFLVTRTKGG